MDALLKQELEQVRESSRDEAFQINDLGAATWAFRKLQAIEAQEKEIKDTANSELTRIREWEDLELVRTKSDREYFESLLTDYYTREHTENPKFRLSTPFGKVTSRKSAAGIDISDSAKVINSLKKEGAEEFIKVTEEVKKGELKKKGQFVGDKFVLPDGQIIDGVKPKSVTEKITVKVEED